MQVASYKLLPVVVRAMGPNGIGWMDDDDRKDVALIVKKYLKHRIEGVWAEQPQQDQDRQQSGAKKLAVDLVKARRRGNRTPLEIHAAFRPLPAVSTVLQPALSSAPAEHFSFLRYTTSPNELVLQVHELVA